MFDRAKSSHPCAVTRFGGAHTELTRGMKRGMRSHVQELLVTCGLVSVLLIPLAPADAQEAAPVPTRPDDEPEPEGLKRAQPSDAASGIAVAHPEPDHRVANGLLAVPRTIALIVLSGPRFAAKEIDDYLEGRSPDARGRFTGKQRGFRFGAVAEGETRLGASIALRVGYRLGRQTAVDAYGGLFGPRGQSGGVRAALGQFTSLELQPSISVDVGRKLARVYSGVGELGMRTTYLERRVAATAGLSAQLGPLQLVGSTIVDRTGADDEQTGTSMVAGFDETQRAATGELALIYDSRRITHPWIHTGAWSTGFYVRAAAAYTNGEASRSGAFDTVRGTLEARRLFDLFRGDRVLSVGVRGETVSGEDLPFDRLPSLGGRDRLRALARDELRGRTAAFADVQYEWALGADSRAFVFAETGGVAAEASELGTADLHLGYGGGLRYLTGETTSLRAQLAGSADGHVGFYLQLGAL